MCDRGKIYYFPFGLNDFSRSFVVRGRLIRKAVAVSQKRYMMYFVAVIKCCRTESVRPLLIPHFTVPLSYIIYLTVFLASDPFKVEC